MNPQLILASASKRRSKILAELGVMFTVVNPKVDELIHPADPEGTVIENSRRKNEWCRRRFGNAFILSADTIVEFNGRIITKPASTEEAREFLRMLSGKTHQVFTGVAFSRPSPLENSKGAPREVTRPTEYKPFCRPGDLTGRAFLQNSKLGNAPEIHVDISEVTFKDLSDTTINKYIREVNPMDRAGAYDIDENGDLLVASFSGSRTNIMGLSSETVVDLLKPEGLL